MNTIRALVNEATERDEARAAFFPSPPLTTATTEAASRGGIHSAEELSCWLCVAPVELSLVFRLHNGSGGARVLCYACFGLCYRTLLVPCRLGYSPVRPTPTKGTLTVPESRGDKTSVAAAGRAVAALVQQVEPQIAAALLGAAPRCAICRTPCALPRNTRDGLPGSLCMDGQPHVRWRCVYCWHQHTHSGSRCEQCGRDDGAHQWQCPGCLGCGRDGAGEPWGERCRTASFAVHRESNHGTISRAEEEEGKAPTTTAVDPRGAGGYCGHCCQFYPTFIHDCGSESAGKKDSLAPFEASLAETLTAHNYSLLGGNGGPLVAAASSDLFTVLAACLLGDPAQHAKLRAVLSRAIEDHAEEYEPYFLRLTASERGRVWHEVSRRSTRSPGGGTKQAAKARRKESRALFRRYLSRLRRGHGPDDELCLQAAARYFNVVLHVFTADPGRWHVIFTGAEWVTTGSPEERGLRVPRVTTAATTPPTATGAGNGISVRCFVRCWAPMPSAEGPEEESKQGNADWLILVDERPSRQAEQRILRAERLHFFLRRPSPGDGYTAYEHTSQRWITGRNSVLESLSSSLQAIADDARTSKQIRARLEKAPTVPRPLRHSALALDDFAIEGSGRSYATTPPSARSRGPPTRAPPQRTGVGSQLQEDGATSVRPSPPTHGPSQKRTSKATANVPPVSIDIPLRATGKSSQPPTPPARVGRRGSSHIDTAVTAAPVPTPRDLHRGAASPAAVTARATVSAASSPLVPRSRGPQFAPPLLLPHGAEAASRPHSPPSRPPRAHRTLSDGGRDDTPMVSAAREEGR